MKLRCVLIDDEKPARERLKRMLSRQTGLEIVGEAADAGAAVALIDRERPDVCFLDVRMPEGDGFEVLARVRHRPHVIFTTAFDEYAVRAFEVNSLDYLLKPFSRGRLDAALQRARERMAEEGGDGPGVAGLLRELRAHLPSAAARPADAGEPAEPSRITARRGARIVLLDPRRVRWFEAEETLVFAHTGRERVLVERTLADLEARLAPRFFRTHRRYLVNLEQVAEILPGDAGTYRIVMRGEDRAVVTLSRRQARRLREIFPW